MSYFRIEHTIVSAVIGNKYPQVERVIIPTTWEDPLFIESFIGQKAPSNVLLPKPVLNKSSKITDLVSASTVGLSQSLLVSYKLYSILEKIKSVGIQFFEVTLIEENNQRRHKYSIIHPFNFYYNSLNFADCEIGYSKSLSYFSPFRPLIVNRLATFEAEITKYENSLKANYKEIEYLSIRKIAFNKEISTDFFALHYLYGGTGFFVSERLREKIEDNGCTGIVFADPNEPYSKKSI